MKSLLKSLFVEESQIPPEYRLEAEVHQREYLSNGDLRQWTGETQTVYSPICVVTPQGLQRKVIGSYPKATDREAMEALYAAETAYNNGFGEWPTKSVAERIGCVEKFVSEMKKQKEKVVKLLMWEIGKTYPDSVKEFDRTVAYIYSTIDALKEMDRESSRFQIEEGIVAQIRRSPLGVVLCMGPYNYPLNETYITLLPALIMGNTVLLKPPKHGTLLHYPLLEAFRSCFPKGVVNTIYGSGQEIIEPIMRSGKINVLTLIGSSKVANELKKQHPKVNRLRAILGLDAKNAAIITAHADVDLAVKEVVLGALSFNGQRCTALKIIFVHQSIAEEFNKKLCEKVNQLKPGMPWDKDVAITPLPEPKKPIYLTECINDALSNGAKVLNENGGVIVESFFYPAVVYPVNSKMKLYKEEQFGPVIPVVPFNHLEEPIDYLVDSKYGQQVSLFSNNAEEIAKLIDPLTNQVSRLNINCQCQRGPDVFPFTGRKDSAEGTLSVIDALRSYSIRTLVAAKLNDANKAIINEIVDNRTSQFLSTRSIL